MSIPYDMDAAFQEEAMTTTLVVVAVIVVLAIAIILILAAMKPDTFRLERSATINSPPEKVFPFINDFRRWVAWSPWEKIDADLKRDYGGAESGKGATYAWEGKKAGIGRMQITESAPSSRILIDLDFVKPFKASNKVEFTFEPQGDGTRVNWAMTGRNIFIGKIISIFMNMDKMVGKDFEKGLAALKAEAEK
jgi:uncharacterized protein YndB with AHSA1/START domain